jgi:hypothetical protein
MFVYNPNVISVYAGTTVEEINAIPGLVKELQEMSRICEVPKGSEDQEVFLGKNRVRVREIGERLNTNGGYNLMLWAAKQVPEYDQRELECAWHGIGEWMS